MCIEKSDFLYISDRENDRMSPLTPLTSLDPEALETRKVLRKLASAGRQLAELKGVAASMPHQGILINTLGIQEAKDSSEIENIVTTHDELFQDDAWPEGPGNPAAKEVMRYREALRAGYQSVQTTGLLTCNHILAIQEVLERNRAGFRKLPGTALKDGSGRVVYEPPQDPGDIIRLMEDLERFINDDAASDLDPLIKMAVLHHQFESIHPFYDGNGRTGRIINVLYLVKEGLLDIPVLYLSRYIVRNKPDYYRLLQQVRDTGEWEEWILFMLSAIEETARQTIQTIESIQALFADYKHRIRAGFRFYSQDLLNNLFSHPYTKIAFLQNELGVTRVTATKYLDELVGAGFLAKRKIGRSNYYINVPLFQILTGKHPDYL